MFEKLVAMVKQIAYEAGYKAYKNAFTAGFTAASDKTEALLKTSFNDGYENALKDVEREMGGKK